MTADIVFKHCQKFLTTSQCGLKGKANRFLERYLSKPLLHVPTWWKLLLAQFIVIVNKSDYATRESHRYVYMPTDSTNTATIDGSYNFLDYGECPCF